MKKIIFFISFIFFICFLLFFYKKFYCKNGNTESQVENKSPYFDLIQVEKYTSSGLPFIMIHIDNFDMICELDLGFRGILDVTPDFVKEVSDKKFSHFRTVYGFKGKEYENRVYEIPKILIGNSTFSGTLWMEEGFTETFHDDVALSKEKEESIRGEARVGWELFAQSNLFLDFKNSKIAFCNSIQTLKDQGYFLGSFIKTPLFLERGLIEVDTKTSKGYLRCLLDTGCTFNMIHQDLEVGYFDPDKVESYSSFKIGSADLGPIDFYPIRLNLPIHIDAILGMDFFSEHVVFLDLKNAEAYFCKNLDHQ